MYDSQSCCFSNIQVGDIMSGEGETNGWCGKRCVKMQSFVGWAMFLQFYRENIYFASSRAYLVYNMKPLVAGEGLPLRPLLEATLSGIEKSQSNMSTF